MLVLVIVLPILLVTMLLEYRQVDLDQNVIDHAMSSINGSLDKLQAKGKLSEEVVAAARANITTSTDLGAAAEDCDLIIEAIVENLLLVVLILFIILVILIILIILDRAHDISFLLIIHRLLKLMNIGIQRSKVLVFVHKGLKKR